MAKSMKSGLAGKLGAAGQKAVATHKDDETKFPGGGSLPSGIENGIAQLVECKFDQFKNGDNTGEYYFMAAGVMLAPTTHDGVPIAGLRTQLGPEPLCATPKSAGRKTVEEHIAWVLNEFRKLGVDTSGLTIDDLESTAEALKQEAPTFRVRTWKGKPTPQYPDPRVNEQWRGACEFDGEVAPPVEDHTAAEPEAVEEEAAAEEEAVDLTALGAAADGGDGDAAAQLEELANAAGIDPEKIESWAEVAAMLEGGEEAEAAPEEEEVVEEAIPAKGEIWYYKPPKAKKAVECEISAVFEKSKKVNLKNLDSGEIINAIDFNKLSSEA
jgi:hypothetical protein